MLSFMRKHARSWFIKVLLGAVIVVFIFFYGFSLRDRQSSLIADVNGFKIALRDFQVQFERLLEAQRSRASDLTPEQRRALKETTLEHLIDQVLLLEQADRWGIEVSDGEIKEFIRSIPAFQADGQFSLRQFQQYLRSRGLHEGEFMKDLTHSLRIQKVENLIRDGVRISEDEMDTVYRLFNERIVLQYVALGPEAYLKDVSPSAEEIQAYFKDHVAEYRIPEMARVKFIRFDAKDFLTQVEVSPKELEQRYQANQDRWKESKQVLARQILIHTTEQDDDKTRMKALQKAEDLIKKLQNGEDFAKLAKEHSQDNQTAAKGGSLDWKRQGELPEALEKALFEEMSPGQLSERPVKSPQGFHILKLEEVRAERVKPLDEVREILDRELKQEKARQRASEMAEEAYLEIFKGAEMETVAKHHQIPVETTAPFPQRGPVKDLSVGESFRKAAFSLKQKDDFSEVVEDGGAFYTIELVDRTPGRDSTLEEADARVRADVQRIKAVEKAWEAARELSQTIQDGKTTLSESAQKSSWRLVTSPALGRVAPAPGLPMEMVQAAFSLPPDATLLPQPYRQGDRFLVGEIKERTPADPKGMQDQRSLFRSLLLRDRRESLFRDWMMKIRARASIKTYSAYQDML
jgi:peptidyl-prolyl cis-trans isomerase D